MPVEPALQPDQDTSRWDAYALPYERTFEPLTDAFAAQALRLLGPLAGCRLLDVGAGAGGAALLAAALGAKVSAVDAAPAMVRRMTERGVRASVQDGAALRFPDACFDAALSCFGVVLMPEPARGMAELRRVLRPGGRVAIVTWTQPHRYALAARLRAATLAVRGDVPQGALPAQLRFIDPARLHALLADAGFQGIGVETVEAALHAPSAEALAGSLAFAPGMAATLEGLGPARDAVLAEFVRQLHADGQTGPVVLGAVAHVAVGHHPHVIEGARP